MRSEFSCFLVLMFVFLFCDAPQFLAQGGFNFSFFFSQIQTGLVSATGSKYIGGESGSAER